MKDILPLFFICGICHIVGAQPTFQKVYFEDSITFLSAIDQTPDGGFVIGGGFSSHTVILKVNEVGEVEWGTKTSAYGVFDIISAPDGSIYYLTVGDDAIGNARQVVVKLNQNGEKLWDMALGTTLLGFYKSMSIDLDGNLLVTQSQLVQSQEFVFHKISPAGSLLWSKSFDVGLNSHAKSIVASMDGGYLVVGVASGKGVMMKTDENGEVEWVKQLSNSQINSVSKFPNGDYLVSGQSNGFQKMVLSRMSPGGALLWTKSIPLKGVSVSAGAFVNGLGEIIMKSIVGQSFLGLIKLNGDGTLAWAKGYPVSYLEVSTPVPAFEGGYAFLSAIREDSILSSVLVRTDDLGRVADCEVFDLCIEVEDFEESIMDIAWNEIEITIDTTFEATHTPISIQSQDFCTPLIKPTPFFQIPDSVCVGTDIAPFGLNQENADWWSWKFEGGIPDSSSMQAPTGIVFPNAGTFQVRQVISFGGCLDTFQQTITVIPLPETTLPPDTTVCKGSSLTLDVSASNAVSYLWDNGYTQPVREIMRSGIYTLTTSNGFCSATDSIHVSFISDVFDAEKFDLGFDTTICNGLEISIGIDQTIFDEIWWNDGVTTSPRSVSRAGTYVLNALVNDCLFSDSIFIDVEYCDETIYTPSAFSPNGDGINDLFTAYGKFLQIERLLIFHRWGGMAYEAHGPDAAWNGTSKDKPAQPGVYVYLLEYTDTRTGERFMKSGEVVLVR